MKNALKNVILIGVLNFAQYCLIILEGVHSTFKNSGIINSDTFVHQLNMNMEKIVLILQTWRAGCLVRTEKAG